MCAGAIARQSKAIEAPRLRAYGPFPWRTTGGQPRLGPPPPTQTWWSRSRCSGRRHHHGRGHRGVRRGGEGGPGRQPQRPTYRPSALRDLSGILRYHVAPELGELPLRDVGRRHVQALVDRLAEEQLSESRIRSVDQRAAGALRLRDRAGVCRVQPGRRAGDAARGRGPARRRPRAGGGPERRRPPTTRIEGRR